MILDIHFAPPFMTNGFVLGCADTREGVIIDPGDCVEDLIDAATRHQLSINYILLTHAHLDHITGVDRAKAAFPTAPVVVGMILGPLAEAQLRNALSIGEGSAAVFVQRPMSIVLIVIIVAVLVLPRLAKRMSQRKGLQAA